MMILGHAYEDGRGTQKDTTAAKMWYRMAAEHGAVDAFHALGSLFFSEKDYLVSDRKYPFFAKNRRPLADERSLIVTEYR